MAEGPRHTGDPELERDLLQRARVSRLQTLIDERLHLLPRDPLILDPLQHLVRRELAVTRAVGHVERPHRVLGTGDELDSNGHGTAACGGAVHCSEELFTCISGS